jgi:hypothetical protein
MEQRESQNRFYVVFEVHGNLMLLFNPMVVIDKEILKTSGPYGPFV